MKIKAESLMEIKKRQKINLRKTPNFQESSPQCKKFLSQESSKSNVSRKITYHF
jgi:hypothetical protein